MLYAIEWCAASAVVFGSHVYTSTCVITDNAQQLVTCDHDPYGAQASHVGACSVMR